MAGPVEVIPCFINSPIDLLAASLFDVMAPLALKVAYADGAFHDAERELLYDYFIDWGYDHGYIDVGLDYAEANLLDTNTEEVARVFARLCKDNRDCKFPSIALHIEDFLEELIHADGRVNEVERCEMERIRRTFQQYETNIESIWNRSSSVKSSIRKRASQLTKPIRDNTPRAVDDLNAVGEAALDTGGKFVRHGASSMAKSLSAASKALADFADKSDQSSHDNRG